MTTRAQLTTAAKAAGVTVTYGKDKIGPPYFHEVVLTAPDGFCFDGDVHERVVAGGANDPIESLYDLALADLKTVTKCERPDCDWCHGGDDANL